jgi:hypothetical protein
MHKIDPSRPSVVFCHLLQKCRIAVTEAADRGIWGDPCHDLRLRYNYTICTVYGCWGRIFAKRTNFGIPNEINAVRFPCRRSPRQKRARFVARMIAETSDDAARDSRRLKSEAVGAARDRYFDESETNWLAGLLSCPSAAVSARPLRGGPVFRLSFKG